MCLRIQVVLWEVPAMEGMMVSKARSLRRPGAPCEDVALDVVEVGLPANRGHVVKPLRG